MKQIMRAAFGGAILLASTPATIALAQQPVAESSETIIASGDWQKASFASKGEWKIVQRGDDLFVVLDDAFRTKGAPDLKLFLSPQDAGALTGKNATDGALLISPLSSNRGAQEYQIPAGADLADFATLIIHCEQYSKLWSTAAL